MQARNLKVKWLQLDSKWLSVRLRTKWLWVRVQLQSLNFKPSKTLKILRLCELTLNNFLVNTYLWWKFTFRRFEMKSFLRRPTKNLFVIGTPQNFFYFYRPGRNRQHKLSKSVNRSIEFVHVEAKWFFLLAGWDVSQRSHNLKFDWN